MKQKISYKARVVIVAYAIAVPLSLAWAGFLLGWW